MKIVDPERAKQTLRDFRAIMKAMNTKHTDSDLSRVTIADGVRSGHPIIRGTRTTVADIIGWLASGADEEEILGDYPWLESADIRAALAFAAQELRQWKSH